MAKRFFIRLPLCTGLFCLLCLLYSCLDPTAWYNYGSYDHVLLASLPSLKEPSVNESALLTARAAYQSAVSTDTQAITKYRMGGNPQDWSKIGELYQTLYLRDSVMRSLSPEVQNFIAPHGFQNYWPEINYAKTKTAAFYYARGLLAWQNSEEAQAQISQNKEMGLLAFKKAQEARSDMGHVLSLFPIYKDAHLLLNLARNRAGVLLLFELSDSDFSQYEDIPPYWRQELCRFDMKDFNRDYIHSAWGGVGYNQEAYEIHVICDHIYLSPVEENIRRSEMVKELPSKSTLGSREKFTCSYTELQQQCSASVRCLVNISYYDPMLAHPNWTPVFDTILTASYTQTISVGEAYGDLRALTPEQLKNVQSPPPQAMDPRRVLNQTFAKIKTKIAVFTNYYLQQYVD